jgi:hypothetical protein
MTPQWEQRQRRMQRRQRRRHEQKQQPIIFKKKHSPRLHEHKWTSAVLSRKTSLHRISLRNQVTRAIVLAV